MSLVSYFKTSSPLLFVVGLVNQFAFIFKPNPKWSISKLKNIVFVPYYDETSKSIRNDFSILVSWRNLNFYVGINMTLVTKYPSSNLQKSMKIGDRRNSSLQWSQSQWKLEMLETQVSNEAKRPDMVETEKQAP